MANSWEDAPTAAVKGEVLSHTIPENLRKFIYLAGVGKYATSTKAAKIPHTEGDETNIRFALAWADLLLDYPAVDLDYTGGSSPTNKEVNVDFPNQRPGSLTCWFERSFTHSLKGVVKTGEDFEFKFNATQVQKFGIYDENGSTIDIDGTEETWYTEEDDFRPGTPFVISNSANTGNNGFYRVRSREKRGSFVYVIADNWNYEQQELFPCSDGGTADCDFGGDWYTLRGGDGNSAVGNNTDGGKMNNYFAELEDAAYGSDSRDLWWSVKDGYHRYVGNAFGPNDGRPPTGGIHSKDFNGDWVRVPNPSLYHHYDANAHRWIIVAETDGSQPPSPGGDYVQYTQLIPSHEMVHFQADPKERVPPKFDESDDEATWKYRDKVQIKREQITNADELGAINNVIRTGYTDLPDYIGLSSHSQYQTPYIDTSASTPTLKLGIWPEQSDQSPKPEWINDKFDTALQNTIERIVTEGRWMDAVDGTYKINWVDLYRHLPILMIDTSGWSAWDSGTTYGEGAEVKATTLSLQVYVSLQAGNLNNNVVGNPSWWRKYTVGEANDLGGLTIAWQPNLNPDQPFYARLDDELWGENGSAFEYLLKRIGSFDWYYDDSHPFRGKRPMDDAWEGVTAEGPALPGTYNGVSCTTEDDVMDAYWKLPVGTWRRTWKYSLGKPQGKFMKSGDGPAPQFDEYNSTGAAYPSLANGWPEDYTHPTGLYGSFDGAMDPMKMFGHHRMTSPGISNDDPEIAARHKETFTQDGVEMFVDNVRNILIDARAVLEQLTFLNSDIDVSMIIKNANPPSQSSTSSFADAIAQHEAWLAANEPDLVDYISPVSPATRVEASMNHSLQYVTVGDPYRSSGSRDYVGLKLIMPADVEVNVGGANSDGRKVYAILKCETSVDHYDANGDLKKPPGVASNENSAFVPGVSGLVDIACLSDDDFYYGISELNADDALVEWNAGTGKYEFSYKLTHRQYFHYTQDIPPEIHTWFVSNISEFWIDAQINDSVVIEFDWNDFPSALFVRDFEHAEYIL